jgi:hypothetical protein
VKAEEFFYWCSLVRLVVLFFVGHMLFFICESETNSDAGAPARGEPEEALMRGAVGTLLVLACVVPAIVHMARGTNPAGFLQPVLRNRHHRDLVLHFGHVDGQT